MKSTFIVSIISNIFIILFLYTGICKLGEYGVFKEQIAMSPLLHSFAGTIAWILPLGEFAAAILLFVPFLRLAGLYVSLTLMSAFTFYIIAILLFDKDLPCSCGGIINLLSWRQHLVLNSFLILLAFVGIYLHKKTLLYVYR
jgi:hypothetical protein